MCNQRRKKTLDHLYSTHRDAHKALPRPPFGKSDHNSILLIPAYKQKLKQEVLVTRSIRKWSDDADAMLQDCFARTNNITDYNVKPSHKLPSDASLPDALNAFYAPFKESNTARSRMLGPLRGVYLVPSSIPCSSTTVWPNTTPTPSLSWLTTQ